MRNELMDNFKKIIEETKIENINLDFSNDFINSIFTEIWSHYNIILQNIIKIPYPFFIDFSNPTLIVEDNKIFIKLFDSEIIKKYIYDVCNNLSYMLEGNDEFSFGDIRNIKSPDELKSKYPKIYELYDDVIKSYEIQQKNVHRLIANKLNTLDSDAIIIKAIKYLQNFDLFINDICDYFELLLNNHSEIDTAFNKNLYHLKLEKDDDYYNMVYLILINYIEQKELEFALVGNPNNSEEELYEKEIIKIINMLKDYSKVLEVHTKNKTDNITLDYIKETFIKDDKKDSSDEKNESLIGSRTVDYVAFSHGKKYSVPIFYNGKLLEMVMALNGLSAHIHVTYYYLLKYSGLFEYGYDTGERDYVLGLKNEYNRFTISELFKIAMSNMRMLKEKDINFLPNEFHVSSPQFTETKFINYINAKENEKVLYEVFSKILNMKINFNFESIILNDSEFDLFKLAQFYFQINNYMIDFSDRELLLLFDAFPGIYDKSNNFMKFADKSFLRNEDFKELRKKMYFELESRLGSDKVNEILEKIKEINDSEEIEHIINSCLLKKKSISDEIKLVESQKAKTLKSSPEYRVLNQRLKKLMLYKNHFDSEEVINGEGPVFKDCYGFEFDGIYVFDYFSDMEDGNALKKAKRDYGHRIYILTDDDYLKVKDLSSRTEVNKYIKENLEPCADTMFHGENEEVRLLEKIKTVKKCIQKKNYIINLSKTDNPITDEEILITQEEFNYYVSKYISTDEQVIDELKKKSRKFETKESIERENNIKIVYKRKSQQEIKSVLNDEDREEINSEIENTYVTLVKINVERKKKGLEPLSFDSDNYYDVYKAIIDYEEEHHIETKVKRDPKVALATKNRTFYNDTYHCELCGVEEINPIYLESHHFIPISQAGPDDIYNTVCLCTRCHKAIHNGLVTDYQNYRLIKTIRDFITSRIPEALPFFEKTLGFKENSYLEQIEKTELEIQATQQKIEEAFDKDISDDEILQEVDELQSHSDSLQSTKQKLNLLANRIQDYYRHSDEYMAIEEKTLESAIKK